MKSSEKEFLYNLLHYYLHSLYLVAPLYYSEEGASFSIYNNISINMDTIRAQLIKLLNKIEKVMPLYQESDPRCIYLDQHPDLIDGVLKYNPLNSVIVFNEQNNGKILLLINNLMGNKKSRSLKYYFSEDTRSRTS